MMGLRSAARPRGLVFWTLKHAALGRSVCQIKLGNASVFLKGIKSRGNMSLVCENLSRKDACEPVQGPLL
jgi:hypothetical protein